MGARSFLMENLESKDIFQYLNQLGEQGWEMVGLGTAAGGTRYAFKRPKP
jgi:hypothetical protein